MMLPANIKKVSDENLVTVMTPHRELHNAEGIFVLVFTSL
jgi:hypothetical protein